MITEYELRQIENEAQEWMIGKIDGTACKNIPVNAAVGAVPIIGASLPKVIAELRKMLRKYHCHWCEYPLDDGRERHPTKRYHIGCMRELLHYPHHTKRMYRRMMEART